MTYITSVCKPFSEDERKHLATNFFNEMIKNQPYLNELYRHILLKMKYFTIRDNNITQLRYSNKQGWHLEFTYYDMTGCLRPMVIIKKLKRDDCTYEIRINGDYDKSRLLFFYVGQEIMEDVLFILSYGYSKNSRSQDLTDILAQSTKSIKDDIESASRPCEKITEWVGGNWK
ncbi:hypothetical protein QJV38_01875 [Listeria cossartiae subsp. cayugensis]|uniref:Uncharacterized protein n=1 Tax=Listeria cossartiae subsp. cayugensis TaxID=2713505 RepID=A0ABU2ILN8_9LIST|nr:hypothetical protein [Listeria cossartiae]MDT0065616.1 hypothetical protein [Listeria cossartiae subsp. cayugensis]MDT0078780.1 hypothetical protein [Listeria cossartiae subsp. cayugensis]MDT0081616.1 hypothetical protein [Listeria cossartiae subsp. cayugensis]MDT0087849.1 hypothetical protein [Listeria cossartiae subsp. cayugensis]MDT0098232.1 hypothetical protein [Listeria cossartiae subsp. cayugensis]